MSDMRRREFVSLLGGAAAAWPLAARAQGAGKVPTVGVLWHAGSAEEEGAYFKALLDGFRGLGYADGRNIKLEHRFPNEIPERFRNLAAELVSLKVDVLVSVGSATAPYVGNATGTIPVVFTLVGDPVESKLVASLAAPGGNVTGLSTMGVPLFQKRLQFLKEVSPGLSRVALLANPNERSTPLYIEEAKGAASQLGLTIQTFDVRSLDELNLTFDALEKSGAQAITPAPGGLMFQGKSIIAKLTLARRLPTCVWSRETLEVGALMSYGPNYIEIVRRAAVYVDKILKGSKPADMPVEQPTKFQLLVNLKTAKVLGINFPPQLLGIADEVIE
jgi:putative tryptophan/tyrosine transport system substrate-binding protein